MVELPQDKADLDPLAADVAAQWKENESNAIATGISPWKQY